MNELRMQRGSAVCMAITTVIITALIPLGRDQLNGLVEGWWVPASVVIVLGAVAPLLWDATRGSGRWIGPLALLLGIANLISLVLFLIAWTGNPAPPSVGSPPVWSANTVVLPAIVLATVYRPRVPVFYVAVSLVLLGTVQQFAKRGDIGYLAYTNALMTSVLMGVFITAVYGVMHAVRGADARRAQVLTATARAASRSARIAERERLDEVVRDKVIATLRLVSEGVPDRLPREKAAATLAALDGLEAAPAARSGELSAAETVLRVREAINALGDETLVDLEIVDPDARYPTPLGEAIVDAAVEAVANAVQHAGPTASHGLIGVVSADLVRVRIVDDGIGFDPQRVGADRAGIELGICGRMRAERGGGAWVDSAPGEGTMVSLEWRRP